MFLFKTYDLNFSHLFDCTYTRMCHRVGVGGGCQKTMCRNQLSPTPSWAQRIKPRLSCLIGSKQPWLMSHLTGPKFGILKCTIVWVQYYYKVVRYSFFLILEHFHCPQKKFYILINCHSQISLPPAPGNHWFIFSPMNVPNLNTSYKYNF